MLESLTIQAFKACGEATTVPLRPFTLLIGPNGAGKSTILQAIDLLGGVARSTLTEHLSTHAWEYGDLPHLRSGTAELSIRARLRIHDAAFEWQLVLGKRRRPGIARERVVADPDGTAQVLLDRTGRAMWRAVQGGPTAGIREQITQTLTSSWLATLDPDNTGDSLRFPGLCRVADWAQRIRGHFFLDPVKLRAPGRGDHDSIGPNGENLAPFLAGLRKRRPAAFKDLVARVQRHYPRLEALEPRRGQYGWTQLEVVERWNGEKATFNARQVSDGLLRLVAVAAMHASEPRSSVLLLDEIENGLHPRLLGQFTEVLQELPPETQVVVATHSPVAANFCNDDEGIVIVDRGQGGHPRCTPLSKTQGYEKLRAHFDPGELWYNLGEEKLVR